MQFLRKNLGERRFFIPPEANMGYEYTGAILGFAFYALLSALPLAVLAMPASIILLFVFTITLGLYLNAECRK
ncbi:unnamed protein product [marine sediment metagenome]|uniref:Uncharacterized protein n=1 Tax=marine sediment metagenome TaxID=412755 RepID=X1A1A4_9ZZZZ